MIKLARLEEHVNGLLQIEKFRDYAPNGLQIEGKEEVRSIMTGVTASQRCIDEAIKQGVDALIVHHGYFWKGEDPVIRGLKYRRMSAFINHQMALLAYHLPLDAHAEYGNNAQLARRLGVSEGGIFCESRGVMIGLWGETLSAVDSETFAERISKALGRECLLISGGTHTIRKVGICTGGAQGYIEEAASYGLDAFVSGEISEKTTHLARELGIHYFAAGHHATERYGVKALGEYLGKKFGLRYHFYDEENPA